MTSQEIAAADARRRARADRREHARGQVRGPAPRSGDGGGAVDVLSILGLFPSWIAYRGHRQREFLARHGIRHGWSHASDEAGLAEEIERRRPRVILNEVWCAPANVVATLARRYPETQFVGLTHATPAFIATDAPMRHYEFLRLAREFPNCHYATVMPADRVIAPQGAKVVSLPNFCELPKNLPVRDGGPPTVSIIGRDNQGSKNWGGAVAAVELAARSISDLHVIAGSPELHGKASPHMEHLEMVGIPVIRMGWIARWRYLELLARSVDAHLTATLAESFGLVPLEHCLLGRPVTGTPALEWLPPAWQRNAQDPADLANCLLGQLENKKASSAEAIKAAEAVAKENHARLIDALERLLA